MDSSGLSPTFHPVPDAPSAIPPWKRCFDLVGCLLALPFILLAVVVVGCWIQLVSPGAIFFTQERVGYKGRRFRLYKFRTMRVDADAATHHAHFKNLVQAQRPMEKLDAMRDTRLIPGGWLLRACGADELPQLINVVLGDMSLVGPRPCIPYEYDHYSAWHRLRLSSAPGLTGLWQVSGKNRTTFDEMVRLDIRYGRTKSLAVDLGIALRTLPALWTQISDTRLSRRQRERALAPSTPGGVSRETDAAPNQRPPAPSPSIP